MELMGAQPRRDAGDPLTSLVVARGLRALVDGLGGVGQALLTAGLAVAGGLSAVRRLGLARGASAARLGLECGRVLERGSETFHTAAPVTDMQTTFQPQPGLRKPPWPTEAPPADVWAVWPAHG